VGAVLTENHQAVLREIRRHGPLTRAQIVRYTGLSRSSVHALTSELLACGLIGEANRRVSPPRGRPAASFAFNGGSGHVLAIAFQHSSVSVAVADLTGSILEQATAQVDTGADAERALTTAASQAEAVIERTRTRRTVLAAAASLPGPIDIEHGTVGSFSILRGWSSIDPARRLSELLELPVIIDNDANVAAYAEIHVGSAVGCRHLLYVKASTGVGAGLILGGRIYRGATGMAGELGHVTIEPTGRICRCGSKGCLETVAGIDGIIAALSGTHEDAVTIERVIGLAADGDAAAERALAEAGAALGRAIGEVSNLLNPSLVVIGGELSAGGDLLIDPLRASLRRAAMRVIARDIEVVASQLGTRAELLGAAALCAAYVHGDEPAAAVAREEDLRGGLSQLLSA
jgi:predicted NBD/HSP70 family sugar kinase